MSSDVILYYRLPADKAQKVRDEFLRAQKAFIAKLTELVGQEVESVSMRGNYAMRVARVSSVEFAEGVVPDVRWNPSKDTPNEWEPNLRRKAGKELAQQLDQLNGATIFDALETVGISGTHVDWEANRSLALGVETYGGEDKTGVLLSTTAQARQYFTLPDWLIQISGQEVLELTKKDDQ